MLHHKGGSLNHPWKIGYQERGLSDQVSTPCWVAPPTWKVLRDTAPPSARGEAIALHAARNEYEPVQVVVRATAAGTRALSLGNWAGPSAIVPLATLHDVSLKYS
jgi:hypothetical protein